MRLLFWFLLVVLVIFRYFSTQPNYKDGDRVRLSGKVIQDPLRYSGSQLVKIDQLRFYLPLSVEIYYGDYLVVEGEVGKDNRLEDVELLEVSQSQNIVYLLRKKVIDNFKSWLPEPHSSLVAGITLGSKEGIPKEFKDALIATGVTHVVVASGMNVVFVAGFLVSILTFFFKRDLAIPLATLGIFFYCVLSGFEAPVIRASLMASIAFLGQLIGRIIHTYRILLLSALVMLLVRPDWISDIGFILSFVSTLSLLVFAKPIEHKFKFLPNPLREGFSTTLAAQIGATPILFVTFGRVSMWSVLLNSLVLWTVPLIMIIVAFAGVVGLLIPELGRLIVYLAFPLTSWFIWVVNIFS